MSLKIRSYRARGFWALTAVLVFVLVWSMSRHPVEVILAEAANQNLRTMIAVGEVIRERGSTQGFSVTKKNLSAFYFAQPWPKRLNAEAAWFFSAVTHQSRYATHFENTRLFGDPSWADTMRVTAQIGDLTFYRQKYSQTASG